VKSFLYRVGVSYPILESFRILVRRVRTVCSLRANIVKNCRKCRSSTRFNCSIKKKTRIKTYVDNKKKGAA
jgi:hypothetical protein